MQYDVKATIPLAATGSFLDQGNSAVARTRIKGVYAVCGASAGSVVITNGNGGATLLTLNTPTAANEGSVYMILPGEGILAESGLYGTVTNTSSIVIFYG
tara:strand:- start:1176 stop:1475 length:300 start_codon:yes stop_codon:yes gene_type:complete